jgi:hypothetical protein
VKSLHISHYYFSLAQEDSDIVAYQEKVREARRIIKELRKWAYVNKRGGVYQCIFYGQKIPVDYLRMLQNPLIDSRGYYKRKVNVKAKLARYVRCVAAMRAKRQVEEEEKAKEGDDEVLRPKDKPRN